MGSGTTKRKAKGRIGSSFDDFLDEEGIREEVEDTAIKEIISDQIEERPSLKRLSANNGSSP